MVLLRRFAAEAAREEARLFCDELVADDDLDPDYDDRFEEYYETARAA